MLQPAAPVDPKQVRDVAQHASEVFGPSARLKGGRDQLSESGAHMGISLGGLHSVMRAEVPIDHLAEGEFTLDHLHRAAGHMREHLVEAVPADELEARHRGLIDSCLEEGLTVVGSLTAELLMAKGRRLTVRLTSTDAYQTIELIEEGLETRVVRLSGANRLELHSGLHEIGRIVWLMERANDKAEAAL
ncbi:hypothetical protein ACFQ0T_43115 [Kitasatospora gansuensis]